MSLSRSQKKFIKKNRHTLTQSEIANALNLSLHTIKEYFSDGNTEGAKKTQIRDYGENNFMNPLLSFVIFAGLIVVVFANVLSAGFSSDDIDGLVNYPFVGDFSVIFQKGFVITRQIIQALIYHTFHLQPLAFRMVNLLFHFGSVSLVYLLGKRLYNQKIGLIAAVLFSVHPVVIESVTWISGGPYSQYTFFLLATFYTYLRGRTERKWFIVSLPLFLLALSSSEKVIIFPLIPVAYELLFGNIRAHWKKVVVYAALTLVILPSQVPNVTGRLANVETGTIQHARWENPLIQFPFSLSTYLELFFFPATLTLYHAKPLISMQELIMRWVVTMGFFGGLIFTYVRNKHIFFWLLFFLLVLLPVLTPLRVAWVAAERYMYPALVGLSMATALGIYELLRKKKYSGAVYGVLAVIIVLLMARSMIRNLDWQSDDSLWLATLKTSPDTPLIHFNVGQMYARKNQFTQAEAEYKKAIELNPVYVEAVYELGQLYLKNNRFGTALEYYKKTLSIRPSTWQAYQNMGVIYFEQKQYKLSEESILKALAINPNNPSLYANLALTYGQMGQMDKMKAAFAKADALQKLQQKNAQN